MSYTAHYFVISEPNIRTKKSVSKKKNQNFDNNPTFIILALVLFSFICYFAYSYTIEREHKKAKELERIKSKLENCKNCCTQYALRAFTSGWFPCYSPEHENGKIFLKKDEVYKY